MPFGQTLQHYLDGPAEAAISGRAVAAAIAALAATSAEVTDLIALGGLAGASGEVLGRNAGGDLQKALDVTAHDLFRDALASTPVAVLASEEAETLEMLDPAGSLCVAIDPIDGSGNIDVNMPVGTIFSILPAPAERSGLSGTDGVSGWPAGTSQLAAGFMIYGPQTTLVLSLGRSVDMFTLDRRDRTFRLTREGMTLPTRDPDEYAINASNFRHWDEPVRAYIDDCVAGATGPYGRDFNMRWHGAMVAEAYRILSRGGIYLYPSDAREGYREGRLRLIYEAFPIAFLVERAGGAASTGRGRILDIPPGALHQHVPLIFGSKTEVARIEALHHRSSLWPATAAPLFASRSLFRV